MRRDSRDGEEVRGLSIVAEDGSNNGFAEWDRFGEADELVELVLLGRREGLGGDLGLLRHLLGLVPEHERLRDPSLREEDVVHRRSLAWYAEANSAHLLILPPSGSLLGDESRPEPSLGVHRVVRFDRDDANDLSRAVSAIFLEDRDLINQAKIPRELGVEEQSGFLLVQSAHGFGVGLREKAI